MRLEKRGERKPVAGSIASNSSNVNKRKNWERGKKDNASYAL